MQLPNRPTRFRSMFIKPYFQPKNTHNIEPDKLEATAKLDKIKAPLFTPEVPQEPTEPAKPVIKRG